jgi:hypothetical protein
MLATLRTQEDLIAQIVMDATGDIRRRFDAGDQAAATEAERRFVELTGTGFTATKRTGPARRS